MFCTHTHAHVCLHRSVFGFIRDLALAGMPGPALTTPPLLPHFRCAMCDTTGEPMTHDWDDLVPFFTQPEFWTQWVSSMSPETLLEVGQIIIHGFSHNPTVLHSMWMAATMTRWEQQHTLDYWHDPVFGGTAGMHWPIITCDQDEDTEYQQHDATDHGNQEWGNDHDGWSMGHPLMDRILVTVDTSKHLIAKVQEDLLVSAQMGAPGCLHVIMTQVTLTKLQVTMHDLEDVVKLIQEGETVEAKAAKILVDMDDTVRAHKHHDLRTLQQLAGDLLVLLCCRPVNIQRLNHNEKMPLPQLLIDKLNKALGRDFREDEGLLSRLPKCKYHLFTHGCSWGKRKAKPSKRARQILKQQKASQEALHMDRLAEGGPAASTHAGDFVVQGTPPGEDTLAEDHLSDGEDPLTGSQNEHTHPKENDMKVPARPRWADMI